MGLPRLRLAESSRFLETQLQIQTWKSNSGTQLPGNCSMSRIACIIMCENTKLKLSQKSYAWENTSRFAKQLPSLLFCLGLPDLANRLPM